MPAIESPKNTVHKIVSHGVKPPVLPDLPVIQALRRKQKERNQRVPGASVRGQK